MPGSSLLTLLDDIASVLDDVATLTKVASKKSAGVLGDDLALNAEQVSGVTPERELAVVLATAKGSALNKLILVPSALLISALAPWAIVPLLMLGGAFLCFEGFEKVVHGLRRRGAHAGSHPAPERPLPVTPHELAELEREKIRGAIRTDFILSGEIVVIALGSVADAPFGVRVAVLCAIAAMMTVGVYGLVAGIVKLDDLGMYAVKKGGARAALGRVLLNAAPFLMKGLSIAGTAAMFLVGGGILVHGVAALHHLSAELASRGALWATLAPTGLHLVVGAGAGGVLVTLVALVRRLSPAARREADG